MAFNIKYMARVSSSGNTVALKVWTYNGSSTGADDTVAEISAAGYFNDFMQDLVDGDGPLAIGDTIIISGSDGNGMYKVTDVTTNVEVSAFAAANSIDTANIVDGAVTNAKVDAAAAIDFSKLAALPSAEILVGSAGNVATAVAVTGDVTVSNAGVTAIGTSKVLSAMISPLVVKYAAVAISAAEFNGMYAAPKLLVAAGGANTLLVLHRLDLLMTYVGANYAAGGVAAVQYDSTINGAGVIASTTLSAATFQAAASTGFMFNTGVVPQTFSTCVNKGLYLSNITGAFTTGDSTFVAHVWYSVIPTV
jgi:hypothetical protein